MADGLEDDAKSTIIGFEWPKKHHTPGQQPCNIKILFYDKKVRRLPGSLQSKFLP